MVGLMWILAILFGAMTLVNPRSFWYATSAWQFKNPEANEPSAAAFGLGRVVSGLAAVGFGIAAIAMTFSALAPLSQERLDTAGDRAATELSGTYAKYFTPGANDIWRAIGRNDVQVTEEASSSENSAFGESEYIEESYQITGTDDTTIVGCMEIAYEGGLFHDGDSDVSASYAAGEC